MVISLTHMSVNSLFYSAATAIIRYIYIKSSLKPNVQAATKRKAFMWKSIFIVESLGCYNLFNFYILQRGKSGKEKSSLLLYQTCLDPWKNSFVLPVVKVMPLNQALVHAAAWIIVGTNIFLFKHLDNVSRNNISLSETDQIKNRRRNLVPAKVGIFSLFTIMISLPAHAVLYSISIDLGVHLIYKLT